VGDWKRPDIWLRNTGKNESGEKEGPADKLIRERLCCGPQQHGKPLIFLEKVNFSGRDCLPLGAVALTLKKGRDT